MQYISPESIAVIEDQAMDLDINVTTQYEYSGRGMYGAKCVGFIVPTMHDAWQLAMMLATTAGDGITTCDWSDPVTDDFGKGTIIYFPGVQVEGTADDNVTPR